MPDVPRPWAPENEPDVATAARRIARQFPDIDICGLRVLGEGWDNTVFVTAEGVVFRFPRRAAAVPFLEAEARVLPALAPRLPLEVPDPHWHGTPDADSGWPFLGHRLLAGTPAADVGVSDAARRATAPVLGGFLAALHAIDPLPAGLPGDVLDRRDLAGRLPLLVERLEALRRRGLVAEARPWLAPFDDLADPPPLSRAVPVHGDLYARHLLVDGAGRLTGVIDWGDVHAGDPALDLMVIYSFLPAAARPSFFAAYGRPGDEMLRLARLRAIFHSVSVAWYGVERGEAALVAEARRALDFALE